MGSLTPFRCRLGVGPPQGPAGSLISESGEASG